MDLLICTTDWGALASDVMNHRRISIASFERTTNNTPEGPRNRSPIERIAFTGDPIVPVGITEPKVCQ